MTKDPEIAVALIPKTNTPRPTLPLDLANEQLETIDPLRPPVVKFQVITRDKQDIIVGRIKIPTGRVKIATRNSHDANSHGSNSHAFILRRFDTGAVSLTTMFRAAFPECTDEQEKAEAAWVKANFDGAGANASKLRLAGTWITPGVATALAPFYKLEHVLPALISAHPDPSGSYRKSTRSSPAPASPAKPPSAAAVASPPAKRTRRESPAVSSPPPPTRRSARLTSPPAAPPAPALARTPRGRAARRPLEPEPEEEEDDAPAIGEEHEAEVAESKALVEDLKAQRDQALALAPAANPLKRSAQEQREGEDAVRQMNLDGPAPMEVARPIAGTRRFNINLTAEQKAMAWGTLAFAFGLGITSFVLPMLT